MKTKEERDAAVELYAKLLEDAGCREFYLIVLDEGRISSCGNMNGPDLMQVFDRMKGEFEKAKRLAAKRGQG